MASFRRTFRRQLEREGIVVVEVVRLGSGHLRWTLEGAAGPLVTPSTPGKGRSYQNTLALARRLVRESR